MKRLLFLAIAIISAASAFGQLAGHDDSRYSRVHFCWGAEVGGSVDMSGNDMSSFDFNASFGMKYRWIKMLGIGAGADIMVSNSCRTYPVYVDFKTDFSTMPGLLFMNLKAGVGMNYMEQNAHAAGAYVFAGMGVNLARSSRFTSYMLLGYTFNQRPDATDPEPFTRPDLHLATIKLGITF